MKHSDHISIGNHTSGRYRLFCLHCGQHYDPALPISMVMFSAVCKEFDKEHRNHKPGERVFTAEEIMARTTSVSSNYQTRPASKVNL